MDLQPPKSLKLVIFGINLPKRGISPYAIFIKFGLGEGVPGSHPRAKFRHCGLKNVGVQPPKSPKLVFFGINLPKMGIPLKRFLQYFARERKPQDRNLMPNCTTIALKM